MTRRHYVNLAAVVSIPLSITNSQTTGTVSDASSFPSSFPYTALIDGGLATAEVVSVTGAVGNLLTWVRGFDGTSGQAHAAAATFAHVAVKADYDEANAHVNASAAVHGLGGTVVGTTDTQTLTNKTLASPAFTGTATGLVLAGLTWTVPTLPAGYTTSIGTSRTVRYAKDAGGFVHIEGGFIDGSATGSKSVTLFTLPSGSRPAAKVEFAISPSGQFGSGTTTGAGISIATTGVVTYATGAITSTPGVFFNAIFSIDA